MVDPPEDVQVGGLVRRPLTDVDTVPCRPQPETPARIVPDISSKVPGFSRPLSVLGNRGGSSKGEPTQQRRASPPIHSSPLRTSQSVAASAVPIGRRPSQLSACRASASRGYSAANAHAEHSVVPYRLTRRVVQPAATHSSTVAREGNA